MKYLGINPLRQSIYPFGKILYNQIKRSLTSKCAVDVSQLSESNQKTIVVSHSGPITLIGINRPSKKNCLNNAAVEELSEALDAFEANAESSIGIIHGIGGSFCSGFDLYEVATAKEENLPHFNALWKRNNLVKKPLIASITGYAVGVGFELALMCDLRVVEEHARMAFLNRRLGIPIMCGGIVRLPAMVGYSRANDLILSGREITAEEAFNWGIANRLVSCGAGLGQCLSLAQSIVKYPQGSLLADRSNLYSGVYGIHSTENSSAIKKNICKSILLQEGIKGAQKFVNGFGRHGKSTNITTCDRTNFKRLNDNLL